MDSANILTIVAAVAIGIVVIVGGWRIINKSARRKAERSSEQDMVQREVNRYAGDHNMPVSSGKRRKWIWIVIILLVLLFAWIWLGPGFHP